MVLNSRKAILRRKEGMSVYILYYATCLEAATMVLLSDRLL